MIDALLGIQRALEARVQLLTAEPEVAWEGQTYEVRADVPYISTQVTGRRRRPMALNAVTPFEWRGLFTVVVKHPGVEGLRPAYARAGVVEAHFPRGLTLSDGPLRVIIQETDLPPSYTTPGWRHQPVQIAWSCEEPPT